MTFSLVTQLLAIIAVVFFLLSFHARSRKGILTLQLLSLLVWGTHFFLLSAFTGAALIVINGLVTILLLLKEKSKKLRNPVVLYLSVLVFSIFTFLTWKSIYSIFPFLGVCTITFAKWQDVPKKIRMVSIPASVFWIIYDISAGAWGSIIAEVLIIASISLSVFKSSRF